MALRSTTSGGGGGVSTCSMGGRVIVTVAGASSFFSNWRFTYTTLSTAKITTWMPTAITSHGELRAAFRIEVASEKPAMMSTRLRGVSELLGAQGPDGRGILCS